MEKDQPKEKTIFDKVTQVFLPILTIIGFLLTSLKKPEYGLIFNLLAQIFWLYASWVAWKKAGQIGILITTLFITTIVLFGVFNYWIIQLLGVVILSLTENPVKYEE